MFWPDSEPPSSKTPNLQPASKGQGKERGVSPTEPEAEADDRSETASDTKPGPALAKAPKDAPDDAAPDVAAPDEQAS